MNVEKTQEELVEEIKRLKKELLQQKAKFEKDRLHLLKLDLHSRQTPMAIIDWDLDFKVTFWNEAATRLFGYTAEEALGKEAWELIVPKEAEEHVHNIWQDLIDNGGGENSSNSNVTKSGEIIFCNWYNTPLINDNGKVISVTSLVFDITKSQQAEQNLLESENRLKVLSNSSFEGIFILDNGRCIEANETGCKLFGYPYHEIIGMNAIDVIAEKDRKTVVQHISSGFEEPYEVTGLRKDGSTFAAEVQGKSIKYKGENVRLTAVRNISRGKNAELELKESESKFKSIFEHSGDGILIGNNNGEIIEANQSFYELSGYTQEDLIGKHIRFVFSADSMVNTPLRFDLIEEGRNVILERDIIGKNGNSIPIEMNSKRLNENFLISSFRDLTDRHKAEKAIREKNKQLTKAIEKAKSSDRLKSEFLANMSHEIRTPMNGILGFSDMLNEPDLDNEKRKYYTNIIINSGHQLKRIIDDILEISELETKQIKVANTEVCINNLLLEIFAIYDTKAKNNKTPIYLNKGLNDRQSTIFTDEVKLRKILNNLIDNAIHYTTEGYIEVGYYFRNNNLEFFVKDTGIGIKPEMQHLIFERFSQEDKGLSRKYGGLGLGLSIAKENSELLGGNICVESEKGKGSTFYFTVPYKAVFENEGIENKNDPVKIIRNEDCCILIAEDEEVNYLYIETLCKKLIGKVTIIRAKNGQEVIDKFLELDRVDLILMDIKMPVKDGFEATSEIRKINDKVPIIAQTAYSRLDDIEKAREAGCNDFLSKPIDKDKFRETVSRVIHLPG